jgi:REP element-mobilizing transposase RayT
MARLLRIERPGIWYHVTSRGNEAPPIYWDSRDRMRFCELLGQCVENFGLVLYAYVLIDNHYHLFVVHIPTHFGQPSKPFRTAIRRGRKNLRLFAGSRSELNRHGVRNESD